MYVLFTVLAFFPVILLLVLLLLGYVV